MKENILLTSFILGICAMLALSPTSPIERNPILRESTLMGNSMHPTIQDGDPYILDINYSFDDLKVGDIIAYKETSMCDGKRHLCDGWVHRIHSVDGKKFKIKGDNNPHSDRYKLTRKNFVGKVVNY